MEGEKTTKQRRTLYERGTGRILVPSLSIAETVWEVTVGLLGQDALGWDEGWILPRCRVIHTFGMRFVIDVVFLDAEGRIRKVVEALPPWRLAGCWSAESVLELPAGRIRAIGIQEGMTVRIAEPPSRFEKEPKGNPS